VENVLCDQWNRKVIVYGNVKPENVLKRVRKGSRTSSCECTEGGELILASRSVHVNILQPSCNLF
jgi:hypothetical protein